MNFCKKCDFMYYIKINEQDDIKYYCRNCGHEDNELSVNELKVSVYEKNPNAQIHINSWIKHDPTLPHMNTIKCPNVKCKTNEKDQTSDIIYFRYNDTEMKYMYLCTICDFNWKP
jgi:DNA-directed RNA polymerase subunit M/transcription elongation factor TFIIS